MKVFLYIRVPVRISLRQQTSGKSWNAMRRTKAMRWLLLWRQTASPASIRKVS